MANTVRGHIEQLHVCKPMSPATILRIHSIISAALDLVVRYEWADRNVAKNARHPGSWPCGFAPATGRAD